jgi:pullulanase/glycogen debranching enzyme
MEPWPGAPYPQGARWDGAGTNFALYSEPATAVEGCLFDEAGGETRVALEESLGFVWHGYARRRPRERYGFRVHGSWGESRPASRAAPAGRSSSIRASRARRRARGSPPAGASPSAAARWSFERV